MQIRFFYLDLTEEPNATVGVVARGVNMLARRLAVPPIEVGVRLPDRLEEDVLSRLLRLLRLPVEPPGCGLHMQMLTNQLKEEGHATNSN